MGGAWARGEEGGERAEGGFVAPSSSVVARAARRAAAHAAATHAGVKRAELCAAMEEGIGLLPSPNWCAARCVAWPASQAACGARKRGVADLLRCAALPRQVWLAAGGLGGRRGRGALCVCGAQQRAAAAPAEPALRRLADGAHQPRDGAQPRVALFLACKSARAEPPRALCLRRRRSPSCARRGWSTCCSLVRVRPGCLLAAARGVAAR
jgi:hypothetical protein